MTTRDGSLLLYALLPTTRPYVEHYLEQAYDREILRKRLMTAYLHLARVAYSELNRSAMVVAFVQQGREDFEWVCETSLYKHLLQGRSIEEAVRRVRRAVEQNTTLHHPQWIAGIPALYTHLRPLFGSKLGSRWFP